MCATCGCSTEAKPELVNLQTGTTRSLSAHSPNHDHDHVHDHHHHHDHDHHHHHHEPGSTLHLEELVLQKNNQLAERNRGWFAGREVLALNFVSSPGAGKTTLLERTIRDLGGEITFRALEGDQATSNDAERIRDAGCQVVQINTGTGCHLDASMVARGLKELAPPVGSVVLIENVGNLVCPALFDLGERAKIVIASVTEGEDKPIKYPHMFRAASVLLLNKMDLLPYLDFDVERFLDNARQVNHHLQVIQLSATKGDGLEQWYDWIREQRLVLPSLDG